MTLWPPLLAEAEEEAAPRTIAGSIFLYLENDLFTGTDRHYTNGVKITLLSHDLEEFSACRFMPSPVGRLLDKIPHFNRVGFKKNVGLSLGQNMYTPENTQTGEPIEGDRPYAGISYLSGSLQRKNYHQLDIVELTLAVVGPSSLAADVQKLIHRATFSQEPKGWDNQLSDEVGFALAWQRRWRVVSLTAANGLGLDLLPHVGAAAGTLIVMGNTGGTLRLGYNLPLDFGPSLILPGSGVSPPTGLVGAPDQPHSGLSCNVFASADVLASAWSILLDGNTYRRSHLVKKEPLVGNLALGASISHRSLIVTYSLVLRTKEFKGQKKGQDYGSVTFGFSF
ncbi:MAG: lipid A deacylase LpxR family protein [Pseudomonadota bacterium]